MTELSAAYEQLARQWTHEQLGDYYRDAERPAKCCPNATRII